MIQVSSAAGGALRPNVSSARRKQPTIPWAGSVSVPSKSTRSALRRLGSVIGVPALPMLRASPRGPRDRLTADRLVRDRRAQEIEKPGQRGENEEAFQGAG